MKNLTKKTLAILVLTLFSSCIIYAGMAQSNTAVKAEASNLQPAVGSTLMVTLKIADVQNLAGIDATLTWDSSVLSLVGSALNLGVEVHSDGVLHGTNINLDPDNLNSGDIYVSETKVAGSYELVAQSVGASNPAFSGSGNLATLTFSVQKAGNAQLNLQTELADHPASGETAQNIDHTDTVDTVNAGGTAPSPSVPEYTTVALIAVAAAIAAATAVLAVKKRVKSE